MDAAEIKRRRMIGFKALVEKIGNKFFEEHKDSAVYSYGEEDIGLFCFLGISLHPRPMLKELRLSASMDEWDIYASCYVTDTEVIMDKCRLPAVE